MKHLGEWLAYAVIIWFFLAFVFQLMPTDTFGVMLLEYGLTFLSLKVGYHVGVEIHKDDEWGKLPMDERLKQLSVSRIGKEK